MVQGMRSILVEARKPAPEHNKADYDQIIATLQEAGLTTGVVGIRASPG